MSPIGSNGPAPEPPPSRDGYVRFPKEDPSDFWDGAPDSAVALIMVLRQSDGTHLVSIHARDISLRELLSALTVAHTAVWHDLMDEYMADKPRPGE